MRIVNIKTGSSVEVVPTGETKTMVMVTYDNINYNLKFNKENGSQVGLDNTYILVSKYFNLNQ